MSLWPVPFTNEQIRLYRESDNIDRKILRYFGERDSRYMRNYHDDYQAENKCVPQFTICLYGLNPEKNQ